MLSDKNKKEISLAILSGDVDEIYKKFNTISNEDKIRLTEWVNISFSEALSSKNTFKIYRRIHIKDRLKNIKWICSVICIIVICALAFVGYQIYFYLPYVVATRHEDATSHKVEFCYPLIAAGATLLGVLAATIGWLINSIVSHNNIKVQQAITLVSGRFSSGEFIKHASNLQNLLKKRSINRRVYNELSKSNKEEDEKSVESIKYILNYFELIGAGVKFGEIEIGIIENTLKSSVVYYYEELYILINSFRENGKNKNTLCNFKDLYEHFKVP